MHLALVLKNLLFSRSYLDSCWPVAYEKSDFPQVIGCIDGTHVPILAPSQNEGIYVNRKNLHSIDIQAICDANLKFIDIVAKWPGSTHDAFMWRQSEIILQIESGQRPIVNG